MQSLPAPQAAAVPVPYLLSLDEYFDFDTLRPAMPRRCATSACSPTGTPT
jgi:hypothetical protein